MDISRHLEELMFHVNSKIHERKMSWMAAGFIKKRSAKTQEIRKIITRDLKGIESPLKLNVRNSVLWALHYGNFLSKVYYENNWPRRSSLRMLVWGRGFPHTFPVHFYFTTHNFPVSFYCSKFCSWYSVIKWPVIKANKLLLNNPGTNQHLAATRLVFLILVVFFPVVWRFLHQNPPPPVPVT